MVQSVAGVEEVVRSVRGLLAEASADSPFAGFVRIGDREYSRDAIRTEVASIIEQLRSSDVTSGSRVVVGLGVSIGHVCLIFALLDIGALWVPTNPALRERSLRHLLSDSGATHVVSHRSSELSALVRRIDAVSEGTMAGRVAFGNGETVEITPMRADGEAALIQPGVCALMYTSGTTGPPKGVQVTGSMLYMSARAVVEAFGPTEGAVAYLWEPLNHIGGAQMIFVPLISDVVLAFGPKFSASSFWQDVTSAGATHVHYLGGILQMLLRQPVAEAEGSHKVRLLWGAGAGPEVWRACEERFGIALCECYGMTETSSIVTVNKSGPDDGVGQQLPWFEVALGRRAGGSPSRGEILVRGRRPGLITPGYLGRPAPVGTWWHTGDLGEFQQNGSLRFQGRGNDSIRVRGENVSAWEVESVVALHPDVEQSAVVGVRAEVGENEMLLYVVPRSGAVVDERTIAAWLGELLARFQTPRYIQFVDALPTTPSQRVAKGQLARDPSQAVDCHVDA